MNCQALRSVKNLKWVLTKVELNKMQEKLVDNNTPNHLATFIPISLHCSGMHTSLMDIHISVCICVIKLVLYKYIVYVYVCVHVC